MKELFLYAAMYTQKWSTGSFLSNGIIYLLIKVITFIIRSGAAISRQAVAIVSLVYKISHKK